jgi:hypothetical protein
MAMALNSSGLLRNGTLSVTIMDCNTGISRFGLSAFDGYLDVYPNSNFGNFFIEYKNDFPTLFVSISDLFGREVYQRPIDPNFIAEVKFPDKKGMFFVKIYDPNHYLILAEKISVE